MLEDNPFAPRVVTCLNHRKERATHLCTELNCQHNPLLCTLCLNDHRFRALHPHEASLRPLPEAVDWLTGVIRSQSKSTELIFERTIGSRDCEIIRFNLEKGGLLFEEVEGRIESMKGQLEGEMESLLRQFQKQLQLERQQFQRRLEEYRRVFSGNLELLRRDNSQLMAFQNSLKFYNNSNSFTLKLITESERKSGEWVVSQKRVMHRVAGILESHSFTSNNTAMLNRATKSNLFILPYWKADGKETNPQTERQFRAAIRAASSGWVQVPELNDLEGKSLEFPSNKYLHAIQAS